MLESHIWQPVPGADGVRIFPLLRKPAATCSNAFLLEGASGIAVVDPGADPAQAAAIRESLARLLSERRRPVFACLTHAHVDHFLALPGLLGQGLELRLVCRPGAARALALRDRAFTNAEMLDVEVPVLDESLFLPGIARIELGRGAALEIMPAPGHSPDSVCLKVGGLLLAGDLPFAANPGLAGLVGWSREDLVVSLRSALELVRAGGIAQVLPGHGAVIPSDKALRMFASVLERAESLPDVATLDLARVGFLAGFAAVLLEEVARIFAIIAGRLLKVAHYLELLDEPEAAARVLGSIDSAALDELTEDFRTFSDDCRRQNIPRVMVMLKAIQMVGRIESLFVAERMAGLVDASLLRRAGRLLSDFINAAYGIRAQDLGEEWDVVLVLRELLAGLKTPPFEPEAILETLDDRERYVRELTRRIAYEPLFARMDLELEAEGPAPALIDRDVFADMATALLEQFAAAGLKSVRLRVARTAAWVEVRIDSGQGFPVIPEEKRAYIRQGVQCFGGEFFECLGERAYVLRQPAAPAG